MRTATELFLVVDIGPCTGDRDSSDCSARISFNLGAVQAGGDTGFVAAVLSRPVAQLCTNASQPKKLCRRGFTPAVIGRRQLTLGHQRAPDQLMLAGFVWSVELPYLTTKLTRRPGTTIDFTIVLPSMTAAIRSSDFAVASTVASSASGATLILARTLPLT